MSPIQENSQSCHETPCFRSLQRKGAEAWLDSIPTSTKFALNAANFCLATRLRLGCDMPLATALDSCECSQSLDSKGYHLLTCKHGGGPIWTHGSIVNVWANCLSDLHVTHKTVPRDLYDCNHCRPDIVSFNPQSGTDVEWDISLANPWNGDILSLASKEDGAAADRREQQKVTKYGQQFDILGNSSTCIPAVFEHFSRWGVRDLSTLSVNEDGQNNSTDFIAYWRRCISVSLHQCNARVITRKLSTLAQCKATFTI